jgi:hypothetical protein
MYPSLPGQFSMMPEPLLIAKSIKDGQMQKKLNAK